MMWRDQVARERNVCPSTFSALYFSLIAFGTLLMQNEWKITGATGFIRLTEERF